MAANKTKELHCANKTQEPIQCASKCGDEKRTETESESMREHSEKEKKATLKRKNGSGKRTA